VTVAILWLVLTVQLHKRSLPLHDMAPNPATERLAWAPKEMVACTASEFLLAV
jgi:hypothetical protein